MNQSQVSAASDLHYSSEQITVVLASVFLYSEPTFLYYLPVGKFYVILKRQFRIADNETCKQGIRSEQTLPQERHLVSHGE